MRRLSPSEFQIQASFVAMVNDPMLVAIPNAGKRSGFYGKRMQMEGLRKGFPDLFLFRPRGGYHGAAFETKTEKGKLSKHQDWYLTELETYGYKCYVYKSVDEGIRFYEDYLSLGSS